MRKQEQIAPIPDEFSTYEEAAEFWDSHDTADYPTAFRTVEVESALRRHHYDIEIDPDVIRKLRARAKRKNVSLGALAGDLLRQHLSRE